MTRFEEAFDNTIYLDNAATTCILPEVYNEMEPYIKTLYGNASSKHSIGEISKHAIEESRAIIASAIGCSPEEIYFTSGGTEANNWAINGLKNKYRFIPMHMVSTEFEHHSILESLKYRWNNCEDIEYTLVKPEKSGVVKVESITNAFKQNTELCSVMMVNNELGTVQPIDEIAKKCNNNGIIFHCDAVQAFGQMPIDVNVLGISMLSMSAHKIHGPKGVGAIYINNDIKGRMTPFIHGGQQELNMRAGTENVAGIVGFGKATEIALKNMSKNIAHEMELAQHLIKGLRTISGVHLNGDIYHMDPRHVNIRVDDTRAEELMAMLNAVNVFVSAGSACASESNEPSHVLKAIGLTDDEANSSIRISIGDLNTKEEIAEFIGYLKQFISILRGEL